MLAFALAELFLAHLERSKNALARVPLVQEIDAGGAGVHVFGTQPGAAPASLDVSVVYYRT